MLTTISLQNFALAEHISLDLDSGFNVLTGETGAGKSLLFDALAICLGGRCDASQVRFGCEKAEISAVFSYQVDSAEAQWLRTRELDDELVDQQLGEVVIRRVIFANGRSKAWINGHASSVAELKQLGQLLVLMHSQHSQQQLLHAAYPRQWLDRLARLEVQALEVRQSYQDWQQQIELQQRAEQDAETRLDKIQQLQFYLQELEPLVTLDYASIEQQHDLMSHHESLMLDCHALLTVLDEQEHSLLQELASLIRRAEQHHGRSADLQQVYNNLLSAQSELDDAVTTIRHFVDNQSFDATQMEQLDHQLGLFHQLSRKYRLSPDQIVSQYHVWQQQLDELEQLPDAHAMVEQVEKAYRCYLDRAQQLDLLRQQSAQQIAQQLTEHIRQLALPEAYFEFKFEALKQPTGDGLSAVELHFTANKGIPPQPLARIASGGELSRIALIMQVLNAHQVDAEVMVFDEIDVGISGATAEIVGRLLASLAQHVQILCITHQPQVAAQSDQHLLVQKQQTDPATSQITILDETGRIAELARMSGGVEISETTLNHAKQLRQLKFEAR